MKLDCVVTCILPFNQTVQLVEFVISAGGRVTEMAPFERPESQVKPEPEPEAPAVPPIGAERHTVTIPVDTMAGLPPVPDRVPSHEAIEWIQKAGLGEFSTYSTLQTAVAVLLRGPATALDLGAAMVATGHARTSVYAATSLIYRANLLTKRKAQQKIDGVQNSTILYRLKELTP